ncbi:hypothetical protein Acife_0913 [Acidithiobacillus ferrivorans SS3]|uniref:Uncharacterized protein n=1 Tax=Acidithiobacillus ferrivorans SS3 TaxID=743299 RepID=G0JMY3_9PROT|nr:hypothetical protein [Acidithiobacillus ferrivorans]AEM47088.1 hypothetical protein Acife_0913 [Acidithiobacillus ferrivorans SS3]OFA15446.1 hypothetical protein A4U49_12695 [Acidithiobacillus ferrivorans]
MNIRVRHLFITGILLSWALGAQAASLPMDGASGLALLGTAVGTQALVHSAGKALPNQSLSTLMMNGTSAGNAVGDGVITGSNIIQGGAFGNASGFVTVIQNSGNNVLIQNAMQVNLTMH